MWDLGERAAQLTVGIPSRGSVYTILKSDFYYKDFITQWKPHDIFLFIISSLDLSLYSLLCHVNNEFLPVIINFEENEIKQ